MPFHVFYSDEAKPHNPHSPLPVYCRGGVYVRSEVLTGRSGNPEQLFATLLTLRKRFTQLDLGTELSGSKLINQYLEANGKDSKRAGELKDLGFDLCNLVGQYVHPIIVIADLNKPPQCLLGSLGDSEKAGMNPAELESAGRFIAACHSALRLIAHKSGRKDVAGVPCFDYVPSEYLRHTIASYEVFLLPKFQKGHFLGPTTYIPSRFDKLIQLADVYAAFVREAEVGRTSIFRDQLRLKFEAEIPREFRDDLWMKVPTTT